MNTFIHFILLRKCPVLNEFLQWLVSSIHPFHRVNSQKSVLEEKHRPIKSLLSQPVFFLSTISVLYFDFLLLCLRLPIRAHHRVEFNRRKRVPNHTRCLGYNRSACVQGSSQPSPSPHHQTSSGDPCQHDTEQVDKKYLH